MSSATTLAGMKTRKRRIKRKVYGAEGARSPPETSRARAKKDGGRPAAPSIRSGQTTY